MEAYLSKACWRAGTKLVAGLAVLGALVGIRIVTATPAGVEGEIAELARFDAEQASAAASDAEPGHAGSLSAAESDGVETATTDAGQAAREQGDLDRMVRCVLGGSLQFMRAADCATRGGELEELPPPEPEETAAAPQR
jgi:hypothetical protein